MKTLPMKKSFSLLCCAVLISGCAGAPPVKRFTGDRQNTPIHALSVAVVSPRFLSLSYNDKGLKELVQSQQALGTNAGAALPSGLRLFLQSVYEPEKLYRNIIGVYYQDFKSVTVVDSVSDPRVAQADMIAIPEVTFAVYPPNMGAVIAACEFTLFLACLLPWTTKTTLTVTSVFYTPDHSLLATVKAEPVILNRRKMPLADPKLDEFIFPTASVQAAEKLDTALQASPELLQYANGLKSKLGVQASVAPESRSAKIIESDVDHANYLSNENAANYAVVIGVENYAHLPAAAFAKRDAEAMRAHLRALGYPGQNVAMLTDSQATGSKLKSYIESWLPRNVKPESKVFVYFAGYGAPDTESKQAHLLLWDGDPQYISDTGYPLKRLYQKLNELKAKEVIVALDTCFTGAGGRSVLAKGARPLVGKLDTGGASDLDKVVVLMAAGFDEVTGDEKSQGHGLFTYYLLKSLNESSGNDTVRGAFARLSAKVQEAARKANQSQTPQLLGANAAQASLK